MPISTVVTPCRTDSGRPGADEHLGVVVRVRVDEARHDPAAGRLDHLGAGPDGQVVRRHRGDDTISDTEVADGAGRTRSVEPQAAAHDDIEILVLVIHTTHAAECNPK